MVCDEVCQKKSDYYVSPSVMQISFFKQTCNLLEVLVIIAVIIASTKSTKTTQVINLCIMKSFMVQISLLPGLIFPNAWFFWLLKKMHLLRNQLCMTQGLSISCIVITFLSTIFITDHHRPTLGRIVTFSITAN